MKKSYIPPQLSIEEAEAVTIIAESDYSNTCDTDCKIWRFCNDRWRGKYCEDKKLIEPVKA